MSVRAFLALFATGTLTAQPVIEGRLHGQDHATPSHRIPLSTVPAIGSVPGSEHETLSFRTWETQPSGWFRLSGLVGRYTLAFTNPAHFMRPMVRTNQIVRNGEFVRHAGDPVRPVSDTLSVWLRATCKKEDTRFPFRAGFDDFSLRRIDSGVPTKTEKTARSGFIARIPPEAPGARHPRLALVRERRAHIPVLVHRGATRFAPENTLAAFNSAMDRGADGFEIDIRRSSDGILYVFHDDTLDRVTNGSGKVLGRTYFDLLEFELGKQGHRIPTLAAVFTLARDRRALLHLDIKEAGLEPAILRLIEAADLWEHIVSVNNYNATGIRDHERVKLLGYKGWFPDEPDARKPFLKKPGAMVFTKWDPLDAVRALGRDAGDPEPLPATLRASWEKEGR